MLCRLIFTIHFYPNSCTNIPLTNIITLTTYYSNNVILSFDEYFTKTLINPLYIPHISNLLYHIYLSTHHHISVLSILTENSISLELSFVSKFISDPIDNYIVKNVTIDRNCVELMYCGYV